MKRSAPTETFPLGTPSTSCGAKCLEWMISPHMVADFLSFSWEQKPLVIKRDRQDYYTGLISRRTIDNYLKSDPEFAANSLLLTREGLDGKEMMSESSLDSETFNRMLDDECWMAQVVHPQQRNAKVHALLERLENWSGTVWGSNFYTRSSPTSDGFEAFADNVELFILNMAGEAHWRVFQGDQLLTRDSGSDYTEEDLGPAVLDEVLNAGDLLYIPRGFVHSCTTTSGFQYLSLSTYQNQSWCDLLSTAVTETLESSTRANVEFRKGLPVNWIQLFGKAIEETDSNRAARVAFSTQFKALMHQLVEDISLDDIADQMGSDFIALRTPPVVRKRKGAAAGDDAEGKIFGPDPRLNNDLLVRVRNPSWIRVVADEDAGEAKTLIFSCLDNDVSLHMKSDNPLEAEPTSLEIAGTKSLDGMRDLLREWPGWCKIEVLSREVAGQLWEHGIVETTTEDAVNKQPRLS